MMELQTLSVAPAPSLIKQIETKTRLSTLPTPPVLIPVATAEQFLTMMGRYAAPPPPLPRAHVPTMQSLLPYVTSMAPARPLSTHGANVLSDLCHSLKDIVGLAGREEGREVLGQWLGEEGKGVAEFWEREWLVEWT